MGKPANVVKKQRVVSSSAKMKPLPGKKPAKQGGADSSSVEVRSKPVSKAKAASGVDALSPESFLNVDKKNVRGETRLQCACIRVIWGGGPIHPFKSTWNTFLDAWRRPP